MDGAAGSGSAMAGTVGLELVRITYKPEGAFGVLLQGGYPFAVTLEQTNTDLQTKIPEGIHRCVPSRFIRGGYETFEVTGIQGHSRLLFHRGNIEAHTDGCILVALEFGSLDGVPAVLGSMGGFRELMRRFGAYKQGFDLLVRGVK